MELYHGWPSYSWAWKTRTFHCALLIIWHIAFVENGANTYTQYVYLLEFKLRPQYIHLFNCLKEIHFEFDFQKQAQIPPPPPPPPPPRTYYCLLWSASLKPPLTFIWMFAFRKKKKKKITQILMPHHPYVLELYTPVWVSMWLMLHNYIIHPVYIPSNLTIYTDRCYHRKFHGDCLTTKIC